MSLANSGEYLAKTFQGLEETLAQELEQFGASNIKIRKRAVLFDADLETFYKANYLSRVASRFLRPILNFRADSYDELYNKMSKVDWPELMHYDQTFAISSVVNSRIFDHSRYVTMKTKDAIVDQFRARFRKRPFIETYQPDIRFHVHINDRNIRLYFDASGESLHKRGYRKDDTFPAPLSECLAAGMLLQAGWDGSTDLVDPMCGSGTLLIEAGMIARNIAAQRYRTYFSFHNWSDFQPKLWKKVKEDAIKNERVFEHVIKGFDYSQKALNAATTNLRGAGLKGYTELNLLDINDMPAQKGPGFLIVNPPYGDNIKVDDIDRLYKELGDMLKQKFNTWDAWVFTANLDALKNIGLKTSKRIPLFNGPKESRLCLYEMY